MLCSIFKAGSSLVLKIMIKNTYRMAHRILSKTTILIGIMALFALNSCYYDNVEELYPQPPTCDTLNVTFSNDVLPVINTNCAGCHGSSAPAGNISLTNYSEIVASAQNGSLMGTIKHENGWSPMPKNGNTLTDCTILKLDAWIATGTPNN